MTVSKRRVDEMNFLHFTSPELAASVPSFIVWKNCPWVVTPVKTGVQHMAHTPRKRWCCGSA
jgi:hypothetical protein